jgi:LmbE family N-acetylglucosaminyl deacetylase
MIRRSSSARWLAFGALVAIATSLAACRPATRGGAEIGAGAASKNGARPDAPGGLGAADVLVIAPHPDDETLMAAGVIARERTAGRRVAVAIVTNGDLSCERDGYLREAESVAAMKRLGLREEDIFFLGYPDGHLDELGHEPLPPVTHRDPARGCIAGNTTYAGRGAGGTDVHSLLTGRPAAFTSDALVFDLRSLVARLGPRDVYVSHPIDEHPDHAFVYAYLRRALETGVAGVAGVAVPRIHRAVVHIGGCWPMSGGLPPCVENQFAPGEDPPPLPPPLDVYVPGEQLAVPDSMRVAERTRNAKFLAIAEYGSQTGTPGLSYLFTFARAREPFYPEVLVPDGAGGGPGEARLRRAAPVAARGAVSGGGAWRPDPQSPATSRRDLTQRAPVRCRAGDAADDSTLAVLQGPAGGYTVRTSAKEVVLERAGTGAAAGAGAGEVLRRWALPRAAAPARHAVEVAIDLRPDDGGVAEITLRRDGEVLGVAVDPRPVLSGTSIAVSNAPVAQVACEPY